MRSRLFSIGAWPPRRLRGAAAALSPLRVHGVAEAFTLVELLLVLALLSIVISISLPTLSVFFRGRTLDSEARRLLSLTRYGQSRAVSEGIPMVLWVDAEERAYGLQEEQGWDQKDPKAVEFKLGKELKIEVLKTNSPVRKLVSFQLPAGMEKREEHDERPRIKFLPDGSIDEESPPGVVVSDADGAKVTLSQSRNRMQYEIAKQSN